MNTSTASISPAWSREHQPGKEVLFFQSANGVTEELSLSWFRSHCLACAFLADLATGGICLFLHSLRGDAV